MSDKYYELLYNSSLYPLNIINDFGVAGKHWAMESNKRRELSLRHDMVCIYLCNLEEMPYEDILETFQQNPLKRKEPDEKDDTTSRSHKKQRTTSPVPSTSGLQTTLSGSKSSSSSSSILIDSKTHDAPYRFHLIEGMPSPELIQNKYSKEWGIETSSMWDIVDIHLRKFIEVKVSRNPGLARKLYEEKKLGMKVHTALCIVNPVDGTCTWTDHPGGVNGEGKVLSFILARYEFMRALGILDTNLQETQNIEEYIFPSKWFNDLREKWVGDWYPKELDIEVHEVITGGEKRPFAIMAEDLLLKLSNLKETDRVKKIKWKGKLLPEGWTYNLIENLDTDSEMVTSVFEFIKGNEWSYHKLRKKGEDKPDLIEIISEIWDRSEGRNFNVDLINSSNDGYVLDLLGVGAKKKRHNELDETTVQKRGEELSKLQYDCYFDEIIRRMNKPHGLEGDPLIHMLDDLPESVHPIGKIGVTATKKLLENVSKRNSAIYSSRLTNLYSRLGGAYLITKENNKTNHSDVSMMPIYATIRNPESGEKRKAITGVVIRGPQHARSPTDRIPILTLEIMLNNDSNIYLLATQEKHDVWYNDNFILAIRQNSIMKEDPSFVTFNSNSLFVPANLLGVMTMENPNVAPNINMHLFVEDFLRDNIDWFVERFTEGVLMSAIGNSRDEGYFAQLRKLFMLIFVFRRNRTGANWDISAYCDKVNECLIDNPFSMHFHRTILKILKIYDIEQKLKLT
uniref:Polymerase PA n=1 Tax=Hymenopteran orthomyxo-related virus OKIAV175 TaxID=2792559 RepID=A0A7T0M3H4_9ORTO|nr:polymerase PA [Hymenopteran orthomyxo-related virus OKIAV175]